MPKPVAHHPSIAPGEPGHIPTIKVIALAREHCRAEDISEWIRREGQGYPDASESEGEDGKLWEAMAVEFGCRELLARYWSRLSPGGTRRLWRFRLNKSKRIRGELSKCISLSGQRGSWTSPNGG